MFCPQNGARVVTVVSVTSLLRMHTVCVRSMQHNVCGIFAVVETVERNVNCVTAMMGY